MADKQDQDIQDQTTSSDDIHRVISVAPWPVMQPQSLTRAKDIRPEFTQEIRHPKTVTGKDSGVLEATQHLRSVVASTGRVVSDEETIAVVTRAGRGPAELTRIHAVDSLDYKVTIPADSYGYRLQIDSPSGDAQYPGIIAIQGHDNKVAIPGGLASINGDNNTVTANAAFYLGGRGNRIEGTAKDNSLDIDLSATDYHLPLAAVSYDGKEGRDTVFIEGAAGTRLTFSLDGAGALRIARNNDTPFLNAKNTEIVEMGNEGFSVAGIERRIRASKTGEVHFVLTTGETNILHAVDMVDDAIATPQNLPAHKKARRHDM